MKKPRNRIVHYLLCMVLVSVFCLTPMFAFAMEIPEYIKVGLNYGNTALASCKLTSETGFQIINVEDGDFEETLPISAYTTLIAAVENGMVVLRSEDGSVVSASLGKDDCIMAMDYDEDGLIRFENKPYRDGIQLIPDGNNKIMVINYITMDHYLYGVLQGEMGQEAPLEALKAQAVAARSYAMTNLYVHKSYGFHVCTTTHCQVYKGYSWEKTKTNQAVDETSGQILYSEGKPVSAYYHKNSGGYTQNSKDVWSSQLPYLVAVKDSYCPDYSWTATMSFEQIQSRLETCGYQIGSVQSVAISARNESGAVSELTIVGSNDTVTLKKESVRIVLGGSSLKSTQFSISSDSIPTSSINDVLSVSNGSQTTSSNQSVYVISSSESKQVHNVEGLVVSNGSSKRTISSANTSVGEIVTSGSVTFVGKGYGHGIGMAQDSAIVMANQGMRYDEILEYFYTDVEIY
ncbi:SpoIID/LytB domain-containing protein [Anaerovorax sp. IOR16]|uniref:SpoIID/LytB domain-containing protein n=1 Tax=Anaerovorax sp. IOR16 TaxID=2773458 RepID=UPI0019D1D19C|nr:SpoIID/LytB domain-containing protein [Anaerovorax sp. IOR16]